MFFGKEYSAGRLLLTGCNVADARNLRVLRNTTVLVERGTITAVGGFDPAGVDARHIQADGCTATPGLIDAHVHLCLSGRPNCHLELDALSSAENEELLNANLALNLRNGVTTVRDLGCRWGMLDRMRLLERGETVFPTVLTSGPVFTVPEGHGSFFGETVFPEQAPDMIRRLRENGAEVVKIIGTGGTLSPRTDCHGSQYTDEEFSGIMEAVREAGFEAACHAHAETAIEQCLRYNVRSIEHGSYMSEDQVLRLADKDDCFWTPTVCPGRLISGLSEDAADRTRRRRGNIRAAVRYGVNLVAGTDAGIGGLKHGRLPYELDEFMEAGMTPLAALSSATHMAAVMMRMEGRIGVIEPGAVADILLFRGDIENGPFSFHDPLSVIKGGRLLA